MNKPATKEPSMDEILSSIRQIIADDDAAVAAPPARPTVAAAPTPKPAPPPSVLPAAAMKPATVPASPAPLALSAAQMVDPAPAPSPAAKADDLTAMLAEFKTSDPEPDAASSFLADEAELVDPEDIAFEPEPDPEPEPVPERVAPPVMARPEPVAPPPPPVEPRPAPRPAMSVAQAAPLPDPTLSQDLAEELLAPATDAAVQGSISRLSSIAQVGGMGGQTVEGMMRDLLRPMLKDWLDENLPALVERMVEKEIARISRGVK